MPNKIQTPLVAIRDLAVRFALHGAVVDAVRGVSFDIQPGETLALVGESGSGKSVIARAMMGLLPDNAQVLRGEIILHDPQKNINQMNVLKQNANGAAMQSVRGGSVAIIFQEPMVSLSALHTIGDQISEALFLHRRMPRADGIRLTAEMLATVGFAEPEQAMRRYPFELSGGMRQRAMIAMALICHPSLLIADEPTTALDVTIQAQILKLIRRLQTKLNMAVLMITHDLGVVANVASRVVVLYHGEIMECASAQEIFTNPRHQYTRALLNAVPDFDREECARLQPLREIKTEISESFRAPTNLTAVDKSRPLLRVKNLTKKFTARSNAWSLAAKQPSITAVDNVSLELYPGECLGLVGESGSGKSTLGKMIARAISPTDGGVEFRGGDGKTMRVESLADDELFAYRKQVQYIFQDPVGSLNPSMTLFDIIREPLEIHQLGDREYQMTRCAELMRLVGLDPRHLRRYPHSFSGGQRQRIGIARALALQPELLICDEPVSALDVSIQAQVLNLLQDLQRELGLSYLFISHNLAVVDYVADRIAVMVRGKLVELAPREKLFTAPAHPYTRALLTAIPSADLNKPLDFASIADAGDFDSADLLQSSHAGAMQEVSSQHFVRA